MRYSWMLSPYLSIKAIKPMKKLLLFALIIASFTIACTKHSSVTENPSDLNTRMNTANVTNSYIPVDFDLLNIGALHNKHVIWLLDSIHRIPKIEAVIDNARLFFSGLDFQPIDQSNGEMHQHALVISNELAQAGFDFRNLSNPNVSANVKMYIDNLLTSMENSTNLNDMLDAINVVNNDALSHLTDADLDIIKGTCIIARYSAVLWSPVTEGGLGYYDKVNQTSPDVRDGGRIGKFVIGDVSASASYFTSLGIGAALGWGVPGANVAILGGWALSAGIGSLCTLVGAHTVPAPTQPENIQFDRSRIPLVTELTDYELVF